MKAKLFCLFAASALMLSACAAPDNGHSGHPPHAKHDHLHDHGSQGHNTAQSTRYSCRNGLAVSIRRLDNDRIELRLNDKHTVMNRATSGSGVRYASSRGLFGKGAQWHEKGGDALFNFTDPYGNEVETSCRSA